MLTMSEILDKPRAWMVLDASTQVTKDPVYIHRIWYRVGSNGDQIDLFDGVGETGKQFNIMEKVGDSTHTHPIGLIFHDGLYVKDTSGSANIIISYVPLPD